jgi:hypothetical protein
MKISNRQITMIHGAAYSFEFRGIGWRHPFYFFLLCFLMVHLIIRSETRRLMAPLVCR